MGILEQRLGEPGRKKARVPFVSEFCSEVIYIHNLLDISNKFGLRAMEIGRDRYLQKLMRLKFKGGVKIITGLRRSGKSYLLFNIFRRNLLESGVP